MIKILIKIIRITKEVKEIVGRVHLIIISKHQKFIENQLKVCNKQEGLLLMRSFQLIIHQIINEVMLVIKIIRYRKEVLKVKVH